MTRVGTLELRVPQDRLGRFSTELFERYQRSEKALVGTPAEMHVQGFRRGRYPPRAPPAPARFHRCPHEIIVPRQQPFQVDNFRPTLALGHGVHPSRVGDERHHQHAMTAPGGRLIAEPSAHYRLGPWNRNFLRMPRHSCGCTWWQMYTGIFVTSRSLQMPIVPGGQLTPGSSAAETGMGAGAATVVAGAGGLPVIVGAGAAGACKGAAFLSPAVAATSKGLRADKVGGDPGLAGAAARGAVAGEVAIAGKAVDLSGAGPATGMTSDGGDPTTAGTGGGSSGPGISSCWPILIL